MNLGKVTLKPAKDKSIKRFHPWIFSNAIKEIEKGVKDGNAVEVFSNKGKYLGTGHYQQETLCIRIFEFRQQAIDEKYWKLKIELAINNRKEFIDNANTTIFRLIHAEGDDLSGLIIDFYNGTAVIQCHSIGMWLIKDLICKTLVNFPNSAYAKNSLIAVF